MGARDLEVVGVVTPLLVNPFLAHMGGIDEIGIFLIPALLAIYTLRRVEKQARKRAEAEATAAGESVDVDDGSGKEVAPPI